MVRAAPQDFKSNEASSDNPFAVALQHYHRPESPAQPIAAERPRDGNIPSTSNPLEHASALHGYYDNLPLEDFKPHDSPAPSIDPKSTVVSAENPLAIGYYAQNPWGVMPTAVPVGTRKPRHQIYSVKHQRYVDPSAPEGDTKGTEPSYDNPMLHPGFYQYA